jgi:hypothetical protein
MLVVGPEPDASEHTTRLISIDPGAGTVREVESLPVHNGVRLTADGAYLLYIDASMQLVRRALRDGSEEFLSRGGDEKSQLAISADGRAVAYVSKIAGEQDLIYGRYIPGGEFKLASLTDLTGFYSEHFALGATGQHFFAYGSRSVLEELKAEAGAAEDSTTEPVAEATAETTDSESEPASYAAKPGMPARRERFGVIRLDLSASPDTWRINTVRARFIYESTAEFAIAGPFVH